MGNTITGGTQATPSIGVITLADLVSKYRLFLDDTAEPYLWSNEELTSYVNKATNILCREIPLITDSTTAAFCTISVVSGTSTYSVSDRIIKITRAKLASQQNPLPFGDVQYMDGNFTDWEDASNGAPSILLTDGVGTSKVRLYPPPNANDTLRLTVTRMPTVDMTYATHSTTALEIPTKHYDLLDNGVYYFAYLKHDADTEAMKKSAAHFTTWLGDIENAKRSMMRWTQREMVLAPNLAFM